MADKQTIKEKLSKMKSVMLNKKNVPKIVIPLVIVILAVAFLVTNVLKKGEGGLAFQKGVGYVSWSSEGYNTPSSDESLEALRETGADWVSVLVTWYQTTPWSGDVHRTEKTPTDESLIHAVRKAHELGLKVMLKMHLDLLDKSDGSWRGEIGFSRESEWDEWFRKYEEYLMHYVDIANQENVEMLCIGTELSTSATVKGYMWRELIKTLRTKYSGLLTYAAHWDRYLDVRFWDLLDCVGINVYFPLTNKMVPSYEELKEGWQKWIPELEEFYQKTGKPIIFPEIGCSSADGAAIRPWEHVPRSEVNLKLQEDYYRILLESFWNKKWFYGLYWWYWGTNAKMGGKYNRSFTPQNKPAEQVIREWYAKPARR
ncbi:MAG: hypothetical protein ABH869_03885 [Candidatus Omnitrophota bacterium]